LVAPGLETVKLAFSGVGLGGTGVGEAGTGVGDAGTGVGAGACAGARVGVACPAGACAGPPTFVGDGVAFGFAGVKVKVGRCVLSGAGVGVGACPTRRLAHALSARATIIRIKTRNRIELSPF
jgi:hypothetical protein